MAILDAIPAYFRALRSDPKVRATLDSSKAAAAAAADYARANPGSSPKKKPTAC